MTNEFQDFGLSIEILEALNGLGYKKPTNIQQEVIPPMLAGKNIVAKAPTGSGKTAAFAIPICQNVRWEENAPQALVLEPARELAVQVSQEMFHIGRKKRLKVPAVFGGFPIDKQIRTLKQKSHIVAGTPGRVMDHIRRETLKLSNVQWLVIDEADLMLDMGFIDEMKQILSLVPADCRISLFSATLKPEIRELADEFIPEAVLVMQEAGEEQAPAITEKLYFASQERKYDTFLDILMDENPQSCMIFCGTREMTNVLFQKLRRKRIFCGMLHGDMEQKERLKTVNAFRRGGFRFLIATDVAARGIDFEEISHVVNYDFPTGKETYVHRIGRTGRNGNSGTAVSLVTEDDQRMLKQVETYLYQTPGKHGFFGARWVRAFPHEQPVLLRLIPQALPICNDFGVPVLVSRFQIIGPFLRILVDGEEKLDLLFLILEVIVLIGDNGHDLLFIQKSGQLWAVRFLCI